MVALARNVTVDGTTYAAGTDHTAMPARHVDRIRNPSAWVGGTAPAVSYSVAGKPRISFYDLDTAEEARASLGLGSAALLDASDVSDSDTVISVRDHGALGDGAANDTVAINAALAAATPGRIVMFPAPTPGGFYRITDALIVPAGVTVQGAGRGCEIRQMSWAKPVFDLTNVDGCTVRDFALTFGGTRPTALTGVIFRGEDSYGYSSGVWSNGNNHLIENLYVKGLANAVRLVHWTTGNNYAGYRTGNKVLNIEAEGVDFGLLLQGQENVVIDDIYSHDHVDSSNGVNPMHTIYVTGHSTLPSRNIVVGKAHGVNIPGLSGHAHQFKYVTGLTVGTATSDNCSGPWSTIDCHDVTVSVIAGRNCTSSANEGAALFQTVATNHSRVNIGTISLHMTAAEKALSLKADDSFVNEVAIYSDRNGVGTWAAFYDAVVVGNRTKIGNIRIRNRGTTQIRPILVGHPSHPSSDITIAGVSCDNTLGLVTISASMTGTSVVEYNPADQRRIGARGVAPAFFNQVDGTAANYVIRPNGGGSRVNVKDFGAVGDGRRVSDAAMTASSATLTSATAAFTSADIGKRVIVWNAGTTVGSYTAGVAQQLDTTITAVTNSTTATLAAAAVTTVSGTRATIATDDSAPVNAAIATLAKGKELHFPDTTGFYLIRNRITPPADGITVSATSKAVEVHLSSVGALVPAVDAINRNDITVRDISFVSEDGHIWTSTAANLGANYRGDGQMMNHSAVWCNGDRLTVLNVHSVDFENTVYLSPWNTTLASFAQDGRRADCVLDGLSSVDQFCTVLALSTVRLLAKNISKIGYVSAYAAPGHALYHSGAATGTNYPNGLFSTDLVAENISMVDDVTSGGGTVSLKYVRGGRVSNIYARNNGALYSIQLDRVKISGVIGVDMDLYAKDTTGQVFFCVESATDVFGTTKDVDVENVNLGTTSSHAAGTATVAFFHGHRIRVRDMEIRTYRDSTVATSQIRDLDFWGTGITVKNLKIVNLAPNNGGTAMWPMSVGTVSQPTDVDFEDLAVENWAYICRVYSPEVTDVRFRYNPARMVGVDRRDTSAPITTLGGTFFKTRLQISEYTKVLSITGASQTVVPSPALETVTQIDATVANAFTIGAPAMSAMPYSGHRHQVHIRNATAGSLGTITWNAAWALRSAFVAPPAGETHSITFAYNGTTWREVSRSQGAVVDTAAALTSLAADVLTVGEIVPQRDQILTNAVSNVSGTLALSYFTADKTEAINTLTAFTGGTAAGATPTLCRMGVYSVAGNGDLTLVASTANNAGLFATANASAPEALTSTFNKVAGQRYATAILVVSGATMPSFHGKQFPGSNVINTIVRLGPPILGRVTSQTDLPASITAGSLLGYQTQIAILMS